FCLFSYDFFHCCHFPSYWRLYIKKIREKIGDSKMKKNILAFFSVLLIVVLDACGGSDDKESAEPDEDGVTKLVVGASSVPHGEVLEEAKPILEEENIELEIEPYEDYVLPNDDLDNGTLDAN